jgi:hypothetical protein
LIERRHKLGTEFVEPEPDLGRSIPLSEVQLDDALPGPAATHCDFPGKSFDPSRSSRRSTGVLLLNPAGGLSKKSSPARKSWRTQRGSSSAAGVDHAHMWARDESGGIEFKRIGKRRPNSWGLVDQNLGGEKRKCGGARGVGCNETLPRLCVPRSRRRDLELPKNGFNWKQPLCYNPRNWVPKIPELGRD